ncbi:MAG: ribosomal protein S18-alanine N-acetyltransferase, partial [Actinomycetota bacterium]
VVGYGGLITSGLEAHITTIAVDPAYHRTGVGTKLMVGLLDSAIDRGARTLSLEVRRSNYAAQNMYEKFGFRPVGLRPGYYVETGEDAIVMWVDQTDGPEYAELLDRMRQKLASRGRREIADGLRGFTPVGGYPEGGHPRHSGCHARDDHPDRDRD